MIESIGTLNDIHCGGKILNGVGRVDANVGSEKKMPLIEFRNAADFKTFSQNERSHVIYFTAKWSSACQQLIEILKELLNSREYSEINVALIDAEDIPEISNKHAIKAVPVLVFIKNNEEFDRASGFSPYEINGKFMKYSDNLLANESVETQTTFITAEQDEDITERLKKLITRSRLMLFMKGSPQAPRCGFSRQVVDLLVARDLEFSTFDVLSDPKVREGLKEYSNWQTYPQLYLDGKLLGGLDVLREELSNQSFLAKLPTKESRSNRLNSLINQSLLMLFMKGTPENPKCGFSRQIIQLLNSVSAEYQFFDILSDEVIRQSLKEYSNWPTYPQLYLNGKLIGGLDILREEMEDASFIENLPKRKDN